MYNSYIKCIELELNKKPSEWSFKRNNNYRVILEHCNYNHGMQYLTEIKNRYTNLFNDNKNFIIELCKKNDLYGNTIKNDFKNFTTCSASNFRYILHSLLILDYIKENNLNNIDFIEIGGGYGGLCFFIFNLAKLFDISINSFTIFDLLQCSLLQDKYLKALNINNVKCYQINNFNNLKVNSFLISNYAFSEISKELQTQYIDKIINPYTNHGFLAWNFIPVYNFVNNSIIDKEPEYPNTGSNFYVRFKPI